jgi:dUTP pyrophosphatase
MILQVKKLHPAAKLPVRGTPNSIGLDIHAHTLTETGRENTILIPPRITRLIPTGLVVVPPEGWAIFVCSRSGLALKSIFVTNSPGVVDPDYRGELQILLYNGNHESYYVKHQDRIAQIVLLATALPLAVAEIGGELAQTVRGTAGFGSTGR